MQFVQPIPFSEAIDKLGSRSAIGSTLTSSEWADVPVELRERAFFSSQVENVRFLQRAQDAINDYLQGNRETLPDGQTILKTGSRSKFIDIMRAFALKEGMGPLDNESRHGLKDITSERRLGLIFDTQTRQAGDYGFWRQGMDPDVLNEFPAMRFIRVIDVKEPRLMHSPHEDQVYLKTDPIWARVINQDFHVPWGPWGWGCGHDVEDVDRDEAEALHLIRPGQRLQPDHKHFNENLQASTRGLAVELLDKLKAVFGNRLVVQGDTMTWGKAEDLAVGHKTETGNPTPHPGPLPIASLPQRSGEGDTIPTKPVSDALDVRARGGLKVSIDTALEAIDQVHDDGVLPEIEVLNRSRKNSLGYHQSKRVGGELTSSEIGINPKGTWPALTAVHEVGHFLDLSGIGPRGDYATRNFSPMKAVIHVAQQSRAITELASDLNAGYFLKREEIWARAYAQYIAEKSGNPILLADLARAREYNPARQWATEDFKPISDAIDALFTTLGWL